MANTLTHAAERKAFEVGLRTAVGIAYKNRDQGFGGVVDVIQKVLGDVWAPEVYARLKKGLGPGQKWGEYIRKLLENTDHNYLTGLMMAFGYEAAFSGYHQAKKMEQKLHMQIPWVILFDPTSACNLHCIGCWAAEYGHTLNLSYDDMDSIVSQGKALGIHAYVMTGGEPMVRKKDIIKLANKHKDCGFMIFTNGTLVDQKFCDDMKKSNNIILAMSIEGFERATDDRRGDGVFDKVMATMDLLHKNGLIYGTSICYTRANIDAVTSDDFLDFLIDKGVVFSWYFHYMPVGNDASADLIPTVEQREYMYHRIRDIRNYTGGKQIFLMDFQNDGEFVGGCIAGGKNYCHINPAGDVEPCVFIHYSSANIHNTSLEDALKQPLFREYQAHMPFNEDLLRPCPMLENPQFIQQMVHKTGAHSTDMTSPESVEHLTSKTVEYAKEWAPVADKLWASNHPNFKPQKEEEEEPMAMAK